MKMVILIFAVLALNAVGAIAAACSAYDGQSLSKKDTTVFFVGLALCLLASCLSFFA